MTNQGPPCLGLDMHHPLVAGTVDDNQRRRIPPHAPMLAKMCSTCPMLVECRLMADQLEARQTPKLMFGLWAGELPWQRVERRRRGRL